MTTLTHPDIVLNPRTGKRLPPVSTCTAKKLQRIMVDIAAHQHAGGEAYLRWQIAAFQRIAHQRHISVDDAFKEWNEEVVAKTGHLPPLI